MNEIELGVGLLLGAGIVGGIAFMILRLRNLESMRLVEKEKLIDEQIVKKEHGLTDAERDALLKSNLGN